MHTPTKVDVRLWVILVDPCLILWMARLKPIMAAFFMHNLSQF
ncbi:MAG: hypothetical protein PF501_03895 [Salinisphaera sp.]|nr:hypothetical protein [Salinisphaera sp.]